MAIRKIVKYGDPVLRRKCPPVKNMDRELQELIRDMLETMYAAPGIGLAANQIGVSLSLAVIDIQPNGKKNPMVLINPKIIQTGGRLFEDEGCLSLPGFSSKVKRYSYVKASCLNEKGLPVAIVGEGLLARALQHETDHLNGKLYIDKVSWLRRMKIFREIRKKKKLGEW